MSYAHRVSTSKDERMIDDYERLATDRVESIFAKDIGHHDADLRGVVGGSRIAVIGAAGSTGSALVKRFLDYQPDELVLIDLSENNLVELVRDLRSSPGLRLPPRLSTLPIGLGSPELLRFFSDAHPFDHVFNLCALKHVRSERDSYSIARMTDTNVLSLDDFLHSLPYPLQRMFSVSTDKATLPASLMGASKFAMELVLLRNSKRHPYSSARFANVAFSDGSLLHGFLRRVEKRQPIAAPTNIRRFFMSHREAGELCLLAGALGRNRETFFPKLEAGVHEKTFPEIAVALLAKLGYEAVECESEVEAKARASELISEGKWPCHFAPPATSGEKPHEAFHSPSDRVDLTRFEAIGVLSRDPEEVDERRLDAFLSFAREARRRGASKAEYVAAFRDLLGEFNHLETGRNLDEYM